MSRARRSDPARFDVVYAENLPAILAYAGRRCADPADAADVAADVFLVAWRRLGEVPEGEERLWLFGVARRVLANHRRGHRRRSELAGRLRAEFEARPAVTSDDSTIAVTQALRHLPERDRELLTLTVWDGLTPTEIATLEQTSPATVRSRLLRARARLRAELDDEAHGVEPQRNAPSGHAQGAAHSTTNGRSR